jgi:hypothetical protein
MIEIFEGRLGGGKSYSAVYRMVCHLARGGVVATNVEVLWSGLRDCVAQKFGVEIEESQLIKLEDDQVYAFHKYTPSGTPDLPVLCVLDEAHIHFNARDHATTDRLYRETLVFLTQSRKVATDVIFISQSALNLDRQFARLVQYIWRFRDLAKWRIPGLGIMCPLKGILCVQFDYDGRTILQRQYVPKDKAIFGAYNTNSLLRGFPRLEGVLTKRTLSKSTRPAASPFLVGCVGAIDAALIAATFIVK